MKNKDGKLIHMADNIVGIMAVAWKYNNAGQPEELLNPAMKKKKKNSYRFPVTYVLVKWTINDEFLETWEIRLALRRRWLNSTDEAIYDTARMTMDIHTEKYGSNQHQSSSSSVRRGKVPIRVNHHPRERVNYPVQSIIKLAWIVPYKI